MLKGTYKHTENSKEKIRQARLKNPIKYWLGKKRPPHTQETKDKIKESKLKNPTRYWLGKERPKGKESPVYGSKRTIEAKEKMRQAALKRKIHGMLGKHHSEETKEKIKLKKLGCVSPRKGVKLSKETIDKIIKSKVGKYTGENSSSWKGGVSIIDRLCRKMSEYRKWREAVFKRDNYTCQKCGKSKCYITAHHIKGFSKILKENSIKNITQARHCKKLWRLSIGVTLCEDCHKLTDNYKGRANKR